MMITIFAFSSAVCVNVYMHLYLKKRKKKHLMQNKAWCLELIYSVLGWTLPGLTDRTSITTSKKAVHLIPVEIGWQ